MTAAARVSQGGARHSRATAARRSRPRLSGAVAPRPRLRDDLVMVEQSYRGAQSFIVKDTATHKYFRFRPLEVAVMQEFDGERSAEEVAVVLGEQGVAVGSPAIEAFARKLADLGLLERTLAERSVLLLERLRAQRRRRLRGPGMSGDLLRIRWTLSDPDRLLDRWMPRLEVFFTPGFIAASVALFLVYGAIVGARLPELAGALVALYTPSAYTIRLVAVLWCTAMVVIAIHEIGHGVACKHFGGQVHEMGLMLLYFEPAFFCNVNDAWTFPSRRERLWVTAAGSWIQFVLGSLGAIVWWATTPGTLVNEIGLDAALVGGVTAILANVNPLIPLDGYYALSDYLEVPNLRLRARAYLGWLVRRRLLGLAVPEPSADARERRILLVYGLLSVTYIVLVLAVCAALAFGWVGRNVGIVGVVALTLAVGAMAKDTLRGWYGALRTAAREHGVARRLFRRGPRAGLAAVGALLLGLLVPWPIAVTGPFTAHAAPEAAPGAPVEGLVERIFAREGARVAAGSPLVALRNPELEREAVLLGGVADSIRTQEMFARAHGRRDEAAALEVAGRETGARVAEVRERIANLVIRSPVAGVVATPRLEEALGRWVDSGDVVVRVLGTDSLDVRIRLGRAGTGVVRAGQVVHLVPHTDLDANVRALVASVGPGASDPDRPGSVEAHVRLPQRGGVWRPGTEGEASIVVRRGSLLGALWWNARKLLRADLFL